VAGSRLEARRWDLRLAVVRDSPLAALVMDSSAAVWAEDSPSEVDWATGWVLQEERFAPARFSRRNKRLQLPYTTRRRWQLAESAQQTQCAHFKMPLSTVIDPAGNE